ncbi:MAG: hypothetical protein ACLRXQ_04265 [Phascolarctobacterium faecium]
MTNNGFLTVEEAVKAALESVPIQPSSARLTTYRNWHQQFERHQSCKSEMKVFWQIAPSAELKEICDAAGMDDYISVKSNCYETLLRMQKKGCSDNVQNS